MKCNHEGRLPRSAPFPFSSFSALHSRVSFFLLSFSLSRMCLFKARWQLENLLARQKGFLFHFPFSFFCCSFREFATAFWREKWAAAARPHKEADEELRKTKKWEGKIFFELRSSAQKIPSLGLNIPPSFRFCSLFVIHKDAEAIDGKSQHSRDFH